MYKAIPDGFVFLASVAPFIQQSVRYAGSENFIGRPVPGYESPHIILTTQAAEALIQVQEKVNHRGYSLVIYDAYRPQQAVDAFIRWSEDLADTITRDHYYPTLPKEKAFSEGYLARRSGHSRGSTVDLSIIPLGKKVQPVVISERTLTNGEKIPFLDDGTLDMGASFDLFHEASHHDTSLVESLHLSNRQILREAMNSYGFKEYSKEWWHYTLINEPHPDMYFNFPVV